MEDAVRNDSRGQAHLRRSVGALSIAASLLAACGPSKEVSLGSDDDLVRGGRKHRADAGVTGTPPPDAGIAADAGASGTLAVDCTTLGSDCACPSGSNCALECSPLFQCSAMCSPGDSCTIDAPSGGSIQCGGAESCDIACGDPANRSAGQCSVNCQGAACDIRSGTGGSFACDTAKPCLVDLSQDVNAVSASWIGCGTAPPVDCGNHIFVCNRACPSGSSPMQGPDGAALELSVPSTVAYGTLNFIHYKVANLGTATGEGFIDLIVQNQTWNGACGDWRVDSTGGDLGTGVRLGPGETLTELTNNGYPYSTLAPGTYTVSLCMPLGTTQATAQQDDINHANDCQPTLTFTVACPVPQGPDGAALELSVPSTVAYGTLNFIHYKVANLGTATGEGFIDLIVQNQTWNGACGDWRVDSTGGDLGTGVRLGPGETLTELTNNGYPYSTLAPGTYTVSLCMPLGTTQATAQQDDINPANDCQPPQTFTVSCP
jgi:hypothetical protein